MADRDELRAKAARFMALRGRTAEKEALVEANEKARILQAARKAEAKGRVVLPKKEGFSARNVPEHVAKFVAELQANLREVDNDGIPPPVLKSVTRRVRKNAINGTLNGNMGPRNPAFTQMLIHAVLLVCYQYKLTRTEAFMVLKEKGFCSYPMVLNHFKRYATDEECVYSLKQRHWTWEEIEAELTPRRIGVERAGDTLITSRHTFTCEKGLGHKPWDTLIISVIHQGSGCPACYNMVRSEKVRQGRAKAKAERARAV